MDKHGSIIVLNSLLLVTLVIVKYRSLLIDGLVSPARIEAVTGHLV